MHPTKRKITKIIENHLALGNKISAGWLKGIHVKFAAHCISRADRENVKLSEVIYWELYGKPKCPVCGSLPKFRRSIQQGYSTYCSSKCGGQDPSVKQKRIKTNQAKYGTNSPSQVKSIRKKQRKTMLKRYGVEFGGQHPDFVDKAKQTLINKFGVDAPLKSPEILNKARATWTKNYGTDHPMKNRAYFEQQQRAGFKIREVEIQGKIFRVRGYEDHVLHWLVSLGVKAKHILTTAKEGVPSFIYYDRHAKKTRTYHPDMLITKDGKQYVIEVKSTYTSGLMKNKSGNISGKFSNVKAKAKACEDAGWTFKLILVSKNKGNKECALLSNITHKTKRELRKEYKTKIVNLIPSDI